MCRLLGANGCSGVPLPGNANMSAAAIAKDLMAKNRSCRELSLSYLGLCFLGDKNHTDSPS